MEFADVGNTNPENSAKSAEKTAESSEILSDKGKALVSLIVRIIVNATIKECYEESDQVSEV